MADASGNHFGPFDVTVNPDAENYTEANYYRVNKRSGVVAGGALTFTGLGGSLAALDAQVLGSFFWRATAFAFASTATAGGSSPRRDMLVLRQTLTNGATPGTVLPVVIQGTVAASPIDPTPLASDLPLWSWQVPGNAGTTVTAITDLRRYIDENNAPPYAALTGTGLQLVPDNWNLWNVISLAVVTRVSGMSTATSDRITVTKGGLYIVSGQGTLDAIGFGATTGVSIYRNGSRIAGSENAAYGPSGFDSPCATPTLQLALSVGDYLQLAMTNQGGDTRYCDRARSFLQAHYFAPLPSA